MALQPSRPVLINTGLAAALVIATIGAYETIGAPDNEASVATTTAIALGTVSSTVTLTGNLDAPRTVGLPFAGNPGLITDVWAEIGKTVKRGDRLAAVDRRPAEIAMDEARAAVARARGVLKTARAGRTAAEAKLDDANIATAIAALGAAQADLAQAYRTAKLNRITQQDVVSAAARAARVARGDRTDTRAVQGSASASNRRVVATDVDAATVNTDEIAERARSRTRQASSSITRSASAMAATDRALAEAERLRAATLLADRNEIEDRRQLATQASRRLDAARAAAGVSAQGSRPGVVDTAEADLHAAKAKLKAARYALDNTVLKAPFDGLIVDVKGGVGETAASAPPGSIATAAVPDGPGGAENRRPATAAGFVTLADMAHRTVSVKVAEADIDRVSTGQKAKIVFPATGTAVEGTVQHVAEQETVIGGVVQYPVRIALPSTTKEKLGQTASVQIVTDSRANVLTVPVEALLAAGDQKLIAVQRDGRTVKIPVAVGLIGDAAVEVSSPLIKEGDLVLVPSVGR